MADRIFPPIALEAGRAHWTLQDKLARLVELSRDIGYGSDYAEANIAEEGALFDELARSLAEVNAQNHDAIGVVADQRVPLTARERQAKGWMLGCIFAGMIQIAASLMARDYPMRTPLCGIVAVLAAIEMSRDYRKLR